MKRIVRIAAVAAMLIPIHGGLHAQERQVRASLVPAPGSDVSGFAQITRLPHGGSLLHVVVRGLTPGTAYASFYDETTDCTGPADLLGNFTGLPNGTGEVHARIDDDVEQVGSVSVRLGPGYGTLRACAQMHP